MIQIDADKIKNKEVEKNILKSNLYEKQTEDDVFQYEPEQTQTKGLFEKNTSKENNEFPNMIDETSKSLTDNFIKSNESDITISPSKVDQVN